MKHAIILDCLGGDHPLEDNSQAIAELIRKDRIPMIVVGPEAQIKKQLDELEVKTIPDYVQFVDCHEQFPSHRSATEVVKEGKVSIVRCLQLLKEGHGKAVVSAGHTGAAFVASLMVLGRLPGVNRPALAIVYPAANGPTVLLDVGANIDVKPAHLVNFALMGSVYYLHAFKKKKVSVGLLTIGEEVGKGSAAVVQAHEEMSKIAHFPFISYDGPIDGAQVFGQCSNVLVVDGFVGNLLVKTVESLILRLEQEIKKSFETSALWTKFGFLLSKHIWRALKRGVDYQEIGGAPLLGVNGTVIVCHGRSDGATIAQAVRRTAGIDLEAYHSTLKEVMAKV